MRTMTIMALLGAQALAGCSLQETELPPEDDGQLAPPAAGAGVQFRMTSTIEPGQEIERCKLVVAPPEGLAIQRDEVRFTAGSHHVLLYKTPYKEIPTENRRGIPVDGGAVHDCNDGPAAEWILDGLVAGSQSFEGDSLLGSLPDGVALMVEPGTVLVMNTHYLNASSEPLGADARVNLHTIAPERVEEEAGMLFYYNPFIRVPAGGSASAHMRCLVHQDISLVRVQSHMHRRGVGFVANLVEEGSAPQEIYTNTEWEQVPARVFEPFLQVEAGQALDYRCDYENPEARDVMQGLTTRDEMCMLVGPYFPRDRNIDSCLDDNGIFANTWIGSGAATGAETLACLANASPAGEDGGNDFYGCVLNSCPGVATEVSDVLRCNQSKGLGACKSACSTSPEDCSSCVATACAPQVSACQAAACK